MANQRVVVRSAQIQELCLKQTPHIQQLINRPINLSTERYRLLALQGAQEALACIRVLGPLWELFDRVEWAPMLTDSVTARITEIREAELKYQAEPLIHGLGNAKVKLQELENALNTTASN